MPQLMSDCEGGANSILLADGAAPVLVAHGPQLGEACGVTYTQRLQARPDAPVFNENMLLEC